jgi:membrane-associated protein
VSDILHWIESFTGNPFFYVVLFVIALLDSVFPVVPSETTLILGGIAAGQGSLSLPLVIGLAATGALIGDSLAYFLGRRSGGWVERRLTHSARGAQRLAWAEQQLAARGGMLLVTARFIPGGRTMVTFASGLTAQPYRRFLMFDLLACLLWATYGGLLGYFFGDRFKDNHTLAFVYAFGTALSVSALIEAVRWLRHRRNVQPEPESETVRAR